jgi:hypothetical protein
MTHMDDELRRALHRVDPPRDFAERVRARVETATTDSPKWRPASGGWRKTGWALAATLAIVVGTGMWYRAQEQRRAQGEEAKRQVLLSLNIASSKLRAIEMKINHAQEPRQ